MKKYNELTIKEITLTIEEICDEYSSFLDYDCQDEVIEKFFDYNPQWTFTGMSFFEADLFNQTLKTIFKYQVSILDGVILD